MDRVRGDPQAGLAPGFDATAGPATLQARRLAPWSIILMVAAAMSLTIGAALGQWVIVLVAGAIGLLGVTLLIMTALKGGTEDAPKV